MSAVPRKTRSTFQPVEDDLILWGDPTAVVAAVAIGATTTFAAATLTYAAVVAL